MTDVIKAAATSIAIIILLMIVVQLVFQYYDVY